MFSPFKRVNEMMFWVDTSSDRARLRRPTVIIYYLELYVKCFLVGMEQLVKLILGIFHAGFNNNPHLLALGHNKSINHDSTAVC